MNISGNLYLKFSSLGKELSFPSDHIGFSINDSIHRLFSTMSVTIKDQSGGFQEYLLNNPGNMVTVEYGLNEENFVKSEFLINKDSLEALGENPSLFAGILNIELLHSWANSQKAEEGYEEGSISSVLSKITGEYNFNSKDIEDTDYSTIWYYGGKTKANLIREVFLRKANSSTSDNTPFFSFIDSNNNFHFKSYKTMFGEPSNSDFELILDRTVSDKAKFQSSIIDIKRFSDGFSNSKKHEKIRFSEFMPEGNLDTTNIASENYLSKLGRKKYPLSNSIKEPINSQFYYNGYLPDNSSIAEKINLMREDFFKERFVILTPFNPKMRSGKTVTLKLFLPNAANDTYSERYSGKYIIESSSHIWDNQTQSPMTRIMISRKYIIVPEEYDIGKYLS